MKNGVTYISDSRESLPIAWELLKSGVPVDYYVHDKTYAHNFDGMMPKIGLGDLPAALRRNDNVIFDITLPIHPPIKPHDLAFLKLFGIKHRTSGLFGAVADKLMKDHRVQGSSSWTEHIELDREAGFALAKKLGFGIPEYQKFRGLKAGVKFLQSNEGNKERWVFKMLNNGPLDLSYPETYSGEVVDLMLTSLPQRLVKEKFNPEAIQYILQKFVDGVECSNELSWNGNDFANANRTIEDKKLAAGNCGPATGSQSNVVALCYDLDGPAFKELQGLKPYLKKSGYIGPIDANVIFEGEKPWFLEWTPRQGWSSEYCKCAFIPKGQLSNYYLNGYQAVFKDGYVASQLVSLYPYPELNKQKLEMMIKGNLINHRLQDLEDMWLQDVYLDENKKLRCSGSDGIIGIVTKLGDTPEDAINSVCKSVKNLKISGNLQHRCNDHLEKATARINKLRQVGIEF